MKSSHFATLALLVIIVGSGCSTSPERAIGEGTVGAARDWQAAGGNANSKDRFGIRAVDWAVSSGNKAVVKYFLEQGVRGDSLQISGPASQGQLELVKLLLDHGAKVDGDCSDHTGPLKIR